jgi:hypothetical protein
VRRGIMPLGISAMRGYADPEGALAQIRRRERRRTRREDLRDILGVIGGVGQVVGIGRDISSMLTGRKGRQLMEERLQAMPEMREMARTRFGREMGKGSLDALLAMEQLPKGFREDLPPELMGELGLGARPPAISEGVGGPPEIEERFPGRARALGRQRGAAPVEPIPLEGFEPPPADATAALIEAETRKAPGLPAPVEPGMPEGRQLHPQNLALLANRRRLEAEKAARIAAAEDTLPPGAARQQEARLRGVTPESLMPPTTSPDVAAALVSQEIAKAVPEMREAGPRRLEERGAGDIGWIPTEETWRATTRQVGISRILDIVENQLGKLEGDPQSQQAFMDKVQADVIQNETLPPEQKSMILNFLRTMPMGTR